MNNILAAQVLRSHLPDITDGAYKTATEIAIETLYLDAMDDWHKGAGEGLSAREYLELTEEEYYYWLLGGEKVGGFKTTPITNLITNEVVGYKIDKSLEEVCENANENEDTKDITDREKELREKITEECSRKALFWDKENKYTHNYFVSQDNKSYDFQGCPDNLECVREDYTFLALCDEVNHFKCKDCWKNFLRGDKC